MRMRWEKLLFAHWPISPDQLRPLIPKELDLDLRDNSAWLGIVPFTMADVSPRLVPHIPAIADFHELNVRTYVSHRGKSGVWFFSLDAASRLAVRVARKAFHLPYFGARMKLHLKGSEVCYESARAGAPNQFRARYAPVGPVWRAQPGSIDEWLTERYCFYCSTSSGKLLRSEIHHKPWPLQHAEAEIAINTMSEFQIPETAPLLHYANRIDVVGWLPQKLISKAASGDHHNSHPAV